VIIFKEINFLFNRYFIHHIRKKPVRIIFLGLLLLMITATAERKKFSPHPGAAKFFNALTARNVLDV
jgi:hypothetical protein